MPESLPRVSLMRPALKHVPVQDIFAKEPYESRRPALKGEKRLHVLVASPMGRQPGIRGRRRAIEEHAPLQAALGGPVARHPLAQALSQRPGEQRVEAGLRVSQS